MERHRCKLCWRRFGSGRALGGHMRSHVMNPSMHIKRVAPESDTDSGNWEDMMDMEEDERLLCGQEGSMTESVILPDRDSESESSRKVLTGRRSKRIRPASLIVLGFECTKRRLQQYEVEASRSDSFNELEQGSSMSDSTVEDVAFCLMMLSRDKWNTPQDEREEEEARVEHEADAGNDSTKFSKKIKHTSHETKVVADDLFKCKTCSKTFTSYQALGGHKASHNKAKSVQNTNPSVELKSHTQSLERRIHQCPICLRVFTSGQALGGHKRTHANVVQERAHVKCGERVIDLNFPAPADEDGVSALQRS